jgi:hypothetical protein
VNGIGGLELMWYRIGRGSCFDGDGGPGIDVVQHRERGLL